MRKDEITYYLIMLDNLFDLIVSGDSEISVDRQMDYVVDIKTLKEKLWEDYEKCGRNEND